MFYCKKCKQIICPACIIVKHQEHYVIDVFNEKIDVAPYADKLNTYKNKLHRTKQELLDEYNENLIKLHVSIVKEISNGNTRKDYDNLEENDLIYP